MAPVPPVKNDNAAVFSRSANRADAGCNYQEKRWRRQRCFNRLTAEWHDTSNPTDDETVLKRAEFPGMRINLSAGISNTRQDGRTPVISYDDAMKIDPAVLCEFAERYTAAWCSQNPASVAAFFDENGSLQVNDGAPAVGRAAITEVARSFMTSFPDMVVAMDRFVITNHGAEYRWTLTGTNTGPGGTGRSVHISGFEEWQIGTDGLIARSMGHFDAADYDRQLKGAAQTT
jgi:hypothetical protein